MSSSWKNRIIFSSVICLLQTMILEHGVFINGKTLKMIPTNCWYFCHGFAYCSLENMIY